MLISKEFFDQCCPSYQKVIKEFQMDLDNSNFAYDIIEKFYGDCMMPKEYWQLYESWFDNTEIHREDQNAVRQWKDYQQFYYDPIFGELKNPEKNEYFYPKLLNYCKAQNICKVTITEQDILYPHSHLKECFQFYESKESCPPSPDLIFQYEKMKEFYQKIKASETNVEEWFQNLCKFGDNDFIVQNAEYRLGGNLLDSKLWKLYINFLETIDTKKMLEIYSKYCRFFLDDFEMKEEYRKKVETYGPSFVQWNTVFDFEEKAPPIEHKFDDDGHYMDVDDEEEEDDVTPKASKIEKNIFKNFYQNYQNQIFPFQKSLMAYILENGNAAVWRKLHQACKYFFVKKPTPICYRLQVERGLSSFVKESFNLGYPDPDIDFKNSWISTTVYCRLYRALQDNFISTNLLPRLYKCDAKYIQIWNQKLSFNELKLLIGSGNIIKLNLPCVQIKDDKDDEEVNLESIMEHLPNIEKLLLSYVKVNKNTANILCKQKFNSKINTLKLLDIFGEPFDTTEFLNFCKQNRDEQFFLQMEFKPRCPSITYEYFTNFQKFMKESNDLKKTRIEINFTSMLFY